MDYKKFKIEEQNNGKDFIVLVKGWFFWRSGFMATDYFSIKYHSKLEAIKAVEGYKNRFTIIV